MVDDRSAAIGGLWVQGAAGLFGALFGVDLATLCCALIGAWIGAPYARRLKHHADPLAEGEVQAAQADGHRWPTWREIGRGISAALSYFASAIASAVFAHLIAGDATPANAALRNALAVGIGIAFYVLLAKFIEDPFGFIGHMLDKVLPWRRPPVDRGPPP